MSKRILCMSLALIAWVSLAVAGHGQTGNTCDPDDPPWGKQLIEPDSIEPDGGALDTTFVVRKKDLCVPVWSSNLCQGTYTRCFDTTSPGNTAAPCSTTAPCVNARKCVGTETSCTGNSECTTGPQKCAKTWGWEVQSLRAYGYPKDPEKKVRVKKVDDPNLQWGFPGPTLRARAEMLQDPSKAKSASNPAVTPGTRIKIALHNSLEPQDYANAHDCDDAGPNYTPTYPECFHGPNITNLHYHGTHVSPLPHQDYVLLSLWPYGSTGVPISEDTQVGRYQTDINPLPWNQAPGTHWYHPHKHGSTALQVLNGMSGSLLITGPFDDWLNAFYGGALVERLLMVQQIGEDVDYFQKGTPDYPPQALINGLATPQIAMRPGEIQRFRFVGATMQASAALEIGFDERIEEVRQIAQDGVQFAWQNYDRQPYRDSEGTYVNFDLPPGNRADFLIQAPMEPGTYLIEQNVFVKRLPEVAREKFEGAHRIDQSLEERIPPAVKDLEKLVGDISNRKLLGNKPPIDPDSGTPLLFTIEVSGAPKQMAFPVTSATDPACAADAPPARCWPETPAYLADLSAPATAPRELDFSMDGAAGAPPNFFINRTQYEGGCAGAAMTRGSTEDWQFANVKYTPGSNDGLLPHPFHIHINPFQVVKNADRTFDPPYVWQDTIALPVIDQVIEVTAPEDEQPIADEADAAAKCPTICEGSSHATWTGGWTSTACACQQVTGRPAGPIWSNADAQAKCPRACAADNSTWEGNWRTTVQGLMSECDCVTKSDNVLLRQKFEDYTGAYVIHCHFLGHEDRGMMWNVETVCEPGSEPWKFGKPQTGGGPDVCPGTTAALGCCADADGNTDTCGPR